MSEPVLRQFQKWMLAYMTADGGEEDAHNKAVAFAGMDGQSLLVAETARRGLKVYRDGYCLRLLHCLQADYPSLRRWLGEPLFRFFAAAYISERFSDSGDLFEFCGGFVEFLVATQGDEGRSNSSLLLLPVELAKLERARTEILRMEEPEGSIYDSCLPVTTRILETIYPVLDVLRALDRGEMPSPPNINTAYIAVWRKNFRVRMVSLTCCQYHWLGSIAGQPTLSNGTVSCYCGKPGCVGVTLNWKIEAIENGLINPGRV